MIHMVFPYFAPTLLSVKQQEIAELEIHVFAETMELALLTQILNSQNATVLELMALQEVTATYHFALL